MSFVTVAICTWNRAPMLDRVLTHLETLRVPPGTDWEVLVVNNNSTDDTDAVVANHAGRLPIRRAFEPQAGIALARNRAVAEARGDIIAWTDDDAFPEPDWIEKTLTALERFDAEMVFGKVEPLWETGRPPSWFTEKYRGMFALIDLGGPPRVVKEPHVVGFNVNMAFRTSIVAKIGGYRTDIGRGRMAGGEDIDLFQRAHRSGVAVAYEPAAVVRHYIPASRCTKAFYRRYTWGGSPNHLMLLRDESQRVPKLFGLPRYFLRQQWPYLSGYVRALLRADRAEAFYCELKLIRLVGLYWSILTRRDPKGVQHRAGE
ncbi:glycosyltransferase [Limnoglobus roseus]|uniref:GT2 family glycosyltransferase n=1 Tax=Limnoglobus roseus TaxID=2598579 RepID=A0A5C1AUT2_9BACT|nr:glycosyltransferase [Limnoglobus roseus]QEL21024.1 GT2 family glycosyltransferase [Limnoglobus roseus]